MKSWEDKNSSLLLKINQETWCLTFCLNLFRVLDNYKKCSRIILFLHCEIVDTTSHLVHLEDNKWFLYKKLALTQTAQKIWNEIQK